MSCDYRRDVEGKLLVSRRKCDGKESGGSKGFALVCLLTGTDSKGQLATYRTRVGVSRGPPTFRTWMMRKISNASTVYSFPLSYSF
jgi:hypothetical protein